MKKKPTVKPKGLDLSGMRKVMSNMHSFDETTETGRAMKKLWEAHLESQAKAFAKHPFKLAKMSRKEKKKFNREILELRKEAQENPHKFQRKREKEGKGDD